MALNHHREPQPEFVPFAWACGRAGIVTRTGAKLSARGEFSPIVGIGRKPVIARRRFLRWMAEKAGEDVAA
jgi:hypothetical protein